MAVLAGSEQMRVRVAEICILTGLLMHVNTATSAAALLSLCGWEMKGSPRGADK